MDVSLSGLIRRKQQTCVCEGQERGREKAADATESSQERERGIAEMALKPQKRPEWHGGNIKGGTQSYRAAQREGGSEALVLPAKRCCRPQMVAQKREGKEVGGCSCRPPRQNGKIRRM